MSGPQIKDARTDSEIEGCFDVMLELRSNLERSDFLTTVRSMEPDGFRLAYLEDDGRVVTVAGYRIYTTLFTGKNLYVDDLVTSEAARSRGFGRQMLDWLREKARSEGCMHFRLDSGVWRSRAHRFYFQQGLTIAAFSFSESLDSRDSNGD